MKSWLKVIFWVPSAVLCLVIFLQVYTKLGRTQGVQGLLRQEINTVKNEPIVFAALPRAAFEIKTALASEDARPLVIDHYFTHYASPMAGLGQYIVDVADHYKVDPHLIVAIAQQESNLGKIMPDNCHNAWGWGIHSAGTLCFDSWKEGITTFTSGLADKYLAYGLRTPEEIMTKYNSTSPGGAWAEGVTQFLEALQTGDW